MKFVDTSNMSPEQIDKYLQLQERWLSYCEEKEARLRQKQGYVSTRNEGTAIGKNISRTISDIMNEG